MACASVLLLAFPLVSLTSCSRALDQAHSVQTRLNRLEEVTDAQVATPSKNTGAAIEITYNGTDSVRTLTRLVKEVDEIADDEDYPSYRLDLVPADNDQDRLMVDDSFTGSKDEQVVLTNWLATTAALLGDVRYRFEPGAEEIDVDATIVAGADVVVISCSPVPSPSGRTRRTPAGTPPRSARSRSRCRSCPAA